MMNLADMLAFADIHQLSSIAKHYDCECSTHSKHELIQSILSAINRRDIFENTLKSLNLEDLRFLNTLLFDKRELYSLEELLAWARKTRFDDSLPSGGPLQAIRLEPITEPQEAGIPKKGRKRSKAPEPEPAPAQEQPWSPRETILKFKQRGWLFNGHSHNTKYLFCVPADLKRKIGDMMEQKLRATVETSEAPGFYRDEHDLFCSDILQFLRYLHHEDVWLTAEGFIYKRQLQQILQLLAVEEAPVQKGAWRFGYGRRFKEYPNRFSLLYDYCYYQRYIEEDGNRLVLTEQGREMAMNGRRESPADVYRFWIRLYKGPVHNIQALVHWVSRLAEHWVTVPSLARTLCPFIKPYYYDPPESIMEQRVLQMMLHLGLLRAGQHETAGAVVQITPLGKKIINGNYVDERDGIDLEQDSPTANG